MTDNLESKIKEMVKMPEVDLNENNNFDNLNRDLKQSILKNAELAYNIGTDINIADSCGNPLKTIPKSIILDWKDNYLLIFKPNPETKIFEDIYLHNINNENEIFVKTNQEKKILNAVFTERNTIITLTKDHIIENEIKGTVINKFKYHNSFNVDSYRNVIGFTYEENEISTLTKNFLGFIETLENKPYEKKYPYRTAIHNGNTLRKGENNKIFMGFINEFTYYEARYSTTFKKFVITINPKKDDYVEYVIPLKTSNFNFKVSRDRQRIVLLDDKITIMMPDFSIIKSYENLNIENTSHLGCSKNGTNVTYMKKNIDETTDTYLLNLNENSFKIIKDAKYPTWKKS